MLSKVTAVGTGAENPEGQAGEKQNLKISKSEDLMERKLYWWLILGVLGLLLVPSGRAQSTTATMLGNVTDKTGAIVAGAKVTARNTQTNLTRTVSSNEQGEYRIEFLPVGNYELEVNGTGFKKAVVRGIVLQVSVDARADVQLEVGNLNEAVSVN